MVKTALSPFTAPSFEAFAKLANKGDLHHYDWKRFYEFVIVCHRRRLKRTDAEVRVVFREAGFPDHSVREMALVYHHGRGLLKARGWR